MRGSESGQGSMFSYVDLEQRMPHSTVASSEAILTLSSRDHHSLANPPLCKESS